MQGTDKGTLRLKFDVAERPFTQNMKWNESTPFCYCDFTVASNFTHLFEEPKQSQYKVMEPINQFQFKNGLQEN